MTPDDAEVVFHTPPALRPIRVGELRTVLAEFPDHYDVAFPYCADPDSLDYGIVAYASHARIEQPVDSPVVVIR